MIQNKIIPYNPKLKKSARQLRNNRTLSEVLLWKIIKSKAIWYEFHRQVPIDKFMYEQKQETISCFLKHKIMPDTFKNIETEPLIDMPIIKRIRVKFNKPVPLEFESVEDNRGFIT